MEAPSSLAAPALDPELRRRRPLRPFFPSDERSEGGLRCRASYTSHRAWNCSMIWPTRASTMPRY